MITNNLIMTHEIINQYCSFHTASNVVARGYTIILSIDKLSLYLHVHCNKYIYKDRLHGLLFFFKCRNVQISPIVWPYLDTVTNYSMFVYLIGVQFDETSLF